MSIKGQVTNFVAGSVGSGTAFATVGQEVIQNNPAPDTNALIVSIVTIVGGLVSTILTNLLNKLFDKWKVDKKK